MVSPFSFFLFASFSFLASSASASSLAFCSAAFSVFSLACGFLKADFLSAGLSTSFLTVFAFPLSAAFFPLSALLVFSDSVSFFLFSFFSVCAPFFSLFCSLTSFCPFFTFFPSFHGSLSDASGRSFPSPFLSRQTLSSSAPLLFSLNLQVKTLR